MLQVISALKGFAIEASDGRMGTVVDFLFDDVSWKVRWLVVECGTWLKGRKVLIHPSAVSYTALADEEFNVELTKAQVESSPEWTEHEPISQRMEGQLYEHYGWDPLWDEAPTPSAIPGAMASPFMAPPNLGLSLREKPHAEADVPLESDNHLRSVSEVIGYHIHATDGEIGHVENFLIDTEDWSLHYFVVDTSNWWFGKHVLIAPHAVQSIEWSDRHVQIDVSRKQVEESPPWDPLVAFDEVYAKRLHTHYGWPGSGA
jgi:uncharacterized protein YrrD